MNIDYIMGYFSWEYDPDSGILYNRIFNGNID